MDLRLTPELEEMRIPKFTLQPLVENYFPMELITEEQIMLSVSRLEKDGYVEILVTDKDRGMSAEN